MALPSPVPVSIEKRNFGYVAIVGQGYSQVELTVTEFEAFVKHMSDKARELRNLSNANMRQNRT